MSMEWMNINPKDKSYTMHRSWLLWFLFLIDTTNSYFMELLLTNGFVILELIFSKKRKQTWTVHNLIQLEYYISFDVFLEHILLIFSYKKI